MLTNLEQNFNADNVLIAVGFYIGEEKKYNGALPFVIVAAITVLAMIFSEVIFVFVCFSCPEPAQSHPGDLRPLRHLIRVMRKHDLTNMLTIFFDIFDNF